MKDALLLYAKGMAMGAADVVPVSGGTVAFITGIYDELLRSISAVPIHPPVAAGRVAEAWKTANGIFWWCCLPASDQHPQPGQADYLPAGRASDSRLVL